MDLNRRVKAGMTLRARSSAITARTGTAPSMTRPIFQLMKKVIATENASVIGVRTAMRIDMPNAICTRATSVVSLVMIEDVEKRSMFVNENSWTFLYMSERRFFEKPVAAFAPRNEPSVPNASEMSANSTSTMPVFTMYGMSPFANPMSIRSAIL